MAHKMQQRYEARFKRRRADVGELVAQLTEAAMRQLLERLALRNPSLMFDVPDAIEKEETGDPDNERHHPTESVNSWCSCTNCRHMPTAAERVCCRMQPRNCISNRIQFKMLVLNEGVPAEADQHRADIGGGSQITKVDGMLHTGSTSCGDMNDWGRETGGRSTAAVCGHQGQIPVCRRPLPRLW